MLSSIGKGGASLLVESQMSHGLLASAIAGRRHLQQMKHKLDLPPGCLQHNLVNCYLPVCSIPTWQDSPLNP